MADKKNRKPMQLNALDLLKHFQKAKKRVSFIGDGESSSVTGPVQKLIDLFRDADKKEKWTAGDERVSLADFLGRYGAHPAAPRALGMIRESLVDCSCFPSERLSSER